MLDLLKGVRIVDVTTIVLGPMASQILADLGADVVKVEAPEGDLARTVAPMGPDGMGSMFVNNNRNKRGLAIDLKKEEGREILMSLVRESDVFLHNMRPEAIARLGFDAASVMGENPAIIYCAAIGFGEDGPYAGRPAYDDVIQAASGLAALPLRVGREPDYVPSVAADKIVALHVVYAIAAALFRRERSGQGVEIEVPMFETMAAFVLNEHLGDATFAADGRPGYQRLLNPHRRPFRTSDGWIAVLPYTESQWRRALEEIGRSDVVAKEWFAAASDRSRHTGDLYAILAEAMPGRSTDDWLSTFARLDVPHSRVNDLDDLLTDPHLQEVGFFCPTDATTGRVRSIAQPVVFRGAERRPDAAAPALGADNSAILSSLGYDERQIAELTASGVLRD